MVDDLPTAEYVAESFWPGVDETAVRALDERAGARADELARGGKRVRYLA